MVDIVSFSGGKDSTAMLLRMIELNYKIDDIIFIDTGVEFPEMYDHIKKIEKYIGREITKIKAEKSFEYYLGDHIKRNGKTGYGWADFKNRWCTQVMKKAPMNKYLKKYKGEEVIEYHGIAFDEIERTLKNKEKNIKYPLVEWEWIEQDALQYCYDKGFDWNGLYKQFARVSCYLCPLSRLKELKYIYTNKPKLWEEMKRLDKKAFNDFRPDYTLDELDRRFEIENRQLSFFKEE